MARMKAEETIITTLRANSECCEPSKRRQLAAADSKHVTAACEARAPVTGLMISEYRLMEMITALIARAQSTTSQLNKLR
jgi:hypothetical protein